MTSDLQPDSTSPPLPTGSAAADCDASVDPEQFLAIDSSCVTLREYTFSTWNPLVLAIAGILKVFKIPIASSSDDPSVRSLQPFVTPLDDFPPAVREGFAVQQSELASLGFTGAVLCHVIRDPIHLTVTYLVAVASSDGRTIARLHNRTWSHRVPPKVVQFVEYLTAFENGTFLWSLSSKPDMLAPPAMQVVRQVGATVSELWAAHRDARQNLMSRSPELLARTVDELSRTVEAHHVAVRDFHLARKVFRPLKPEEVSRLHLHKVMSGSDDSTVSAHADVMVELDKLQNKKSSIGSAALLLVVSVLVFIGAGAGDSGQTRGERSWEFVLLLVPILLVHELGHLLAMKAFGYRNLRMFFIPFVGAAVSGRSYNVAAWKKVVVALMGPLPGIVLGAGLGAAGLVTHHDLLVRAGILSLVINGMNLLPLFPLDGGRVVHGLLFSRHPLLDTGFRLIAAALLVLASFSLGGKVLLYVGIAMVIGLPVSYKLARIAAELRKAGFQPASTDSQTIPPSAAGPIIERVREKFPKRQTSKTIAQHTLNVFEAINTTPPGWAATILLGVVHVGSFVMAGAFVTLLYLGQQGDLRDVFRAAMVAPKHSVSMNDIASAGAAPVPMASRNWDDAPRQPRKTSRLFVSALFKTSGPARSAFDALRSSLSPVEGMGLFGETIVVSTGPDDAARRRWIEAFEKQNAEVAVNEDFAPAFRLQCIAVSADSAKSMLDEMQMYSSLSSYDVIAPWDPTDPRTPSQRAAHDRARQTLATLMEGGRQHADVSISAEQQKLVDLSKRVAKARIRGEKDEVKRLLKESAVERLAVRARALQAVRDDPSSDRSVAELFLAKYAASPYDMVDEADDSEDGEFDEIENEAQPSTQAATDYKTKMAARTKAYRTYQENMRKDFGPLLGQLPLSVDGQPSPEALRFSLDSGSGSHQGMIVQFHYVSFKDPIHGPAALLKWLDSKKATGFKYDFAEFDRLLD